MSATSIGFRQVHVEPGAISLEVHAEGQVNDLWFRLPDAARPSFDAVACALAAIFNGAAQKYEFDAPISDGCLGRLESATASEWTRRGVAPESRIDGKRLILSFSGGLDSLAALALMGSDAELVAVDFGARFARERDFFDGFAPSVVETNLRGMEKSWTFMGVGAILMREHLGGGLLAFGSILEASPWNFLPGVGPSADHQVFRAAGYRGVAPVVSLTEFGTTQVAALAFPERMRAALASLADVHTEKWFRKRAMLELISRREGLSLDLPDWPAVPRAKVSIGSNFAVDFLAPGMVGHLPSSQSREWLEGADEIQSQFGELGLNFYFRDNPELSTRLPPHMEGRGVAKKSEFGIRPYGAQDWDEMRSIVKWLEERHKFAGATW